MTSLVESFPSEFLNQTTIRAVLLSVVVLMLIRWYMNRKSKKFAPGPIGLPFVGYVPFLGSRPHETLYKLKEKYGNVIGLNLGSKYTVVLNEYNLVKEALSHPSLINRPDTLFHTIEVGFNASNGEEWQEQRRFCMQSMRDLGLGKGPWNLVIQEEVHLFVEELAKSNGEPVNIYKLLSLAVSSNIMSLLIGRRMQKGTEDKNMEVLVNISEIAFSFQGPSKVVCLIPMLLKIYKYLNIGDYDKVIKIVNPYLQFVRGEFRKHETLSELKGAHDFINLYLEKMKQVKDKGQNDTFFCDKNLEGNLNILFLGASDTVLSSLTWALKMMAVHQHIQKKVHDELDEVIGKDGTLTFEDRLKIPYTFAVLMEVERIASIVPLSTTRRAETDIQIGGYDIPKGTEVTGNLWGLHHDPNYWEEPEKFNPERFIAEDGKLILNKLSYIPFSIGRRNCPGETVAWMEIIIYFTRIMQRLEVSPPPGVSMNFEIVNGLVTHLVPQPLCFTQRT